MSSLKLLIAVLLLMPAAAGAQQCPRIEVTCPTEMLEQGTPMTFSASVRGGDPNAQYPFNWTVSAGTITGGQGTPSMTLDTTGLGGQNIKVTVEAEGLPETCKRSESCEARVMPPSLAPHPIDRYRNLKFEDEKARLDNFAITLIQEPPMRGFIVVSAGEGVRPEEARRKARRALSYVTNKRGIDPARVVLVYDGLSDGTTVLWVLPNEVGFPFSGQIIKTDGVRSVRSRVRKSHRKQ